MDYLAINKQAWDTRTKTHVKSQFYDLPGFIQGKSTLNDIELALLGEVSNKSLLHLQCHFGLDTLSLARNGAIVTGVDLSAEAIAQAQEISKTTALAAHFVCSDVYSYNVQGTEKFDHVYTSYGAIIWLPDLDKWANTIASSLKVGGQFTLVEFHPFHDVLEGYSYFHQQEPDIEDEGTYTENCTGETSTCITWAHPLSDVINALIKVGLNIEQVNEYNYSPYNCFEGLEKDENGLFSFKHQGHKMPLIYSIVARKKG